jgi:hypothetical protein
MRVRWMLRSEWEKSNNFSKTEGELTNEKNLHMFIVLHNMLK